MNRSMRLVALIAALFAFVLITLAAFAQQPVISHVDPFLGADGGGNVFPGATTPWGMVKLGPDTEDAGANAGYDHGKIIGFSHLHVSGTGGGPKYGNILVTPSVGHAAPSERADESAAPGYYSVTLTPSGIVAELTATRRVGFHRYTFPKSSDARIVVDLPHCLTTTFTEEAQRYLSGEVEVVSPQAVAGVARYTGGWNVGGEYDVYFYAVTDTAPKSIGLHNGSGLSPERSLGADNSGPLSADFLFDTTAGQRVQLKVGISFISAEQARHNLETEAPGWDFDATRHSAEELWNAALGRVQLRGGTDAQQQAFYTALYHNMMMPVDRTGENPKWQSSEPSYDDYYAIWDIFRSTNPLLTLIAPEREVGMVRSLIDIYRHEGYMPDARSGNDNGRTQGGSNADVVIADAYVKGLKGIDYQAGYEAMVKDAEVPPHEARKEGRGGLKDYNTRGYVTTQDERSGSRTVEYAYDDFCISLVARGLGHKADADKYLARSHNWSNLWDANLSAEGTTGFNHPRRADGSFLQPFNPAVGGSWPNTYYESDSWTYSTYVPQDIRGLIAQGDGDQRFISRLDALFGNNHYDVGNEPGFLLPIYYTWAGRPDLTADKVNQILAKDFGTGRSGLPGNDDSGAMSAWYAFHAMGFFPVAGQDFYVIGTPALPDTTIDLGQGHSFHIVAEGLDAKLQNHFIQSATLNGKPLERAWFRHSEIANGATLVLRMGDKASSWGTKNPPPSSSDPK